MSNITQRIPNLFLGISQQPDNRKFPGQVRDAVNVYPDYALGLLKRPGGQYITSLYNASPSGKWFSIIRDVNEKYVAQYADNTFKVWSILDGYPRAVNMGTNTGVPGGCNLANVKSSLADYNAAKTLTATRLDQLNAAQADYAKKLAGQNSTIDIRFAVNYNYPTGSVLEYLSTGVLLDSGGVYTVKDNNTVISAATTLPAGYALGTERTDEHPLIASNGYRVYEVQVTVAAAYTAGQLSTALGAMTAAQSNYTSAVNDEATKKTTYDGHLSSCAITTVPSNAYLKDATPADIELVTLNDYTFVLNKAKTVAMKAGLTPALPNQAFVVVGVVAYNTQYTIVLNGTTLTYQTRRNATDDTGTYTRAGTLVTCTVNNHGLITGQQVSITFTSGGATNGNYVVTVTGVNTFTVNDTATGTIGTSNLSVAPALDSDVIIKNLVALINAQAGYTATQVGPGIYITRGSAFTIEAKGSLEADGIYVFQDKIGTMDKLPDQCKNGYKVKVVNTVEIDVDDMWAEFKTTNAATYGPGTWEESNAPGITYQLDELTLPHQLVRQSDGSFTYQAVTWKERAVGDTVTNSDPSFVGNTISGIFFYRNRLGFLSEDTVIMSKAGDFFNFFVTSAAASTDDDPIDITASTTKPLSLNYVNTASAGLVLFGQNEQFLLSTDSDILSPKTAKINTLSKYECDVNLRSVEMGSGLAFVSKTPLYSKIFEMRDITTTSPPDLLEDTRVAPELVPSSVNHMISSPGLGVLSVGTTGTDTVYQYKFFQQSDKRPLESWYKWQLTGNLLDQFFDISTYYAVVSNGSKVNLVSMNLTQASAEGFLTLPTGESTDVCLDMWYVNPYRTYTAGTNTTRIYLPYGHYSGKTLSVVILGNYIGDSPTVSPSSIGYVEYPTAVIDVNGDYFDLSGDYRGRDLIIGYIYDMTVDLPKFYPTQTSENSASTDFTADLIIHRMKVSTGLSGPLTYQINITGIPSWEDTVSVTYPYQYVLNNVNLSSDAVHNIPLYQRNNNLLVRIIGDTPFPVSLLNLTWEGKYGQKFYKRA